MKQFKLTAIAVLLSAIMMMILFSTCLNAGQGKGVETNRAVPSDKTYAVGSVRFTASFAAAAGATALTMSLVPAGATAIPIFETAISACVWLCPRIDNILH